jgi:ribosomal protein S18 acetylase RimI-like enzyme
MVKVQIRRMRPDESVKHRDVRLRMLSDSPLAFHSTYQRALTLTDEYWRDLTVEAARGEERVYYIAEASDRWCGMAGGVLAADGTMVEVVSVWVDPAYRGRGVARALIEPVIAWGVAGGATRATLWVHDQNETAIRLYERMGFERTDQRQVFGTAGDRVRFMMTRPVGSERM